MNIGFDGKRAANNSTGLGNYSRWLITQLSVFFPQNQYLIYSPKVDKDNKQVKSFFEGDVQLKLPKGSALGFLWRSLGIVKNLKKDGVTLFHGLSHEIPFGLRASSIKSVVTIHDLIFLRFPQYFKFTDRFIYGLKCKYACRHSDRVIAISEQTKRDIVSYYGIDASKIEVIYQSCDDSFKQIVSEQLKKEVALKYQLPDQYILNVGTVEERKNLLTIVKALKNIDPAYKLVVCGRKRAYARLVEEEIQRLGLLDRVLFLPNVSFSDLPAIYQKASAFVYPSFFEGFGIPIIEALYGGVPVVAATGSCLEEAGGPDSLYVDPNDSVQLSAAINEILNDPILQVQMREKGFEYARNFDNKVLATKMMACYLTVTNGNQNNKIS